jgi:hypothetical protein
MHTDNMLPALAATVIVICYGCAGSRKEPDGQTPCLRCGRTGEPTGHVIEHQD